MDLTEKKKKKKSRKTGLNVKAKKKTAVARAVVKKGSGKVKINRMDLKRIRPEYLRKFIEEPLHIAAEIAKEVDILVKVSGGGFMAQAVAARTAIAKALLKYKNDEKLKQRFLAYDRMLLVDDPRRKEAKKPLGTGARKKKQKSKR